MDSTKYLPWEGFFVILIGTMTFGATSVHNNKKLLYHKYYSELHCYHVYY